MKRTYCEQKVSLATQHGKERAIARPFHFALGLKVVTTDNLDTDTLGTFTGEVERIGTSHEVCERKARLGMATTRLPFGIASEGSFGPHPFIPFIAAGIEIMTFVDDEREIVISEDLITEETNYKYCEVHDIKELANWLPIVGFPSHALIVRPNSMISESQDSPDASNTLGASIKKGISSIDKLESAIEQAAAQSNDGVARIETDMRAHFNPTRMSSIRKLAFKLARRIATTCTSCASPGWGQTGTIKGLPCQHCDTPTEMTRFEMFSCVACDHREQRPRRDGLQVSPQQYCPYCNP